MIGGISTAHDSKHEQSLAGSWPLCFYYDGYVLDWDLWTLGSGRSGKARRKESMTVGKNIAAQFSKLMTAIQEGSYDDFVANGDANFQAKITPQMLNGVSAQLSPRMRKHRTATYLGLLNSRDYVDHLWKLSFKDKNGDRLAQLSIQNGKVHAFYIF
jgi:hypothetical protein